MAYDFEITKGELFCLAAMYGYDSLLNIPYEPEEFEGDLAALFHQISGRLRAKGWLEEDFDGNVTVSAGLELAVSLCAAPFLLWQLQLHSKKGAAQDTVINAYNSGESYLILRQTDGEGYAGMLLEGYAEFVEAVKEYMPLPDVSNTYSELTEDQLSSILEAEPFTLVNISKCSLETDGPEKAILCHDAAMLLLLERGGAYMLYAGDSGNGTFLPVSQAEFDARMEILFAGEEGQQ